MPRPSNTAERRAQITGALKKVMAKHGYDGASVADIAKAARLTSGLVHYHFESKREILLAAVRDLAGRHGGGLETRLESVRGDPMAEVQAFLDYHLGLGADADPEALACWVLFSGEALRDPKVRLEVEGALGKMASRLEEIIRRGTEAGQFSCEDAGAAAGALVALIQGYFVLAATARAVIPRGSAARSARQMAQGLLLPSKPLAAPKKRG